MLVGFAAGARARGAAYSRVIPMPRAAIPLGLVTATLCGGVGCEKLAGLTDVVTPSDAADRPDADPGLLAGCVVRERMEEAAWTGAAGEVVDSCGGDDNGTAGGGAQVVTDPIRGRVGSFPSTPACIVITDRPALRATDGVTMSAWVRTTQYPGGAYGLVSKRVNYGAESAYNMYLVDSGLVQVDLESEDDRFAATELGPVPLDAWHMVTVVYDGTAPSAERVRVYLDAGTPQIHEETAAALGAHPTANLWIGCLPEIGPSQSLGGYLDEVVVWTRALSPTEVADWYAATLIPD